MFKKVIVNGYILGTGEVESNGNISIAEYNNLAEIIRHKPTAEQGYDYRLRADTLEWELCQLPPVDESEKEATIEDYEEAIGRFGV